MIMKEKSATGPENRRRTGRAPSRVIMRDKVPMGGRRGGDLLAHDHGTWPPASQELRGRRRTFVVAGCRGWLSWLVVVVVERP
jgi:hypothetical protein